MLASIIEPRLEEILLTFREIKRTEYADMLGAGIVLTGSIDDGGDTGAG